MAEARGPVEPFPTEANPPRSPIPYVTILIGLLLGFGLLLGPFPFSVYQGLEREMSRMAAWGTTTVLSKVIALIALPLYVMYWERQSLRSIGVCRPTAADVGYGIAAFIAAELVGVGTEKLAIALHLIAGVPALRQRELLSRIPLWIGLAAAFANGMAEELVARGYAIERLQVATRSTLAAAAIALVLDLLTHVPYWGFEYALIIAPSQLLLVLLYMWRRNLSACVIAHILADALPFAIIAAYKP